MCIKLFFLSHLISLRWNVLPSSFYFEGRRLEIPLGLYKRSWRVWTNPSVSSETNTAAGRDVPVQSVGVCCELEPGAELSPNPDLIQDQLAAFSSAGPPRDGKCQFWDAEGRNKARRSQRQLKKWRSGSGSRVSPQHDVSHLHQVHRRVPAVRGAGQVSSAPGFLSWFSRVNDSVLFPVAARLQEPLTCSHLRGVWPRHGAKWHLLFPHRYSLQPQSCKQDSVWHLSFYWLLVCIYDAR